MVQDFLKEIGFSDKEAEIYLALIKVDSDTILDLSRKTKIGRTTIYPIIESLKEKGFVEEVKDKGKISYRAKTPDRIESFLQEQKIKIEEHTNYARRDIIPQIRGLMREDGEKPIIEYHEGREAVVMSSKEFLPLEDSEFMYMIYPRDKIEDLFTEKERRMARELRINRKVRSKSIYSYDKGDYNPDTTGDRYRIDGKKYPINADISIYGDEIQVFILGNKLGSLYIKNKDLAETLKTLFRIAIEGLDKNKKK